MFLPYEKVYQEKENIVVETQDMQDESLFLRLHSYFNTGSAYVIHIVSKNRWNLLGTAGAWFILDVVFYANGLFSGQVAKSMGIASTPKQESMAALILQVSSIDVYSFCAQIV